LVVIGRSRTRELDFPAQGSLYHALLTLLLKELVSGEKIPSLSRNCELSEKQMYMGYLLCSKNTDQRLEAAKQDLFSILCAFAQNPPSHFSAWQRSEDIFEDQQLGSSSFLQTKLITSSSV
jgi:hypothetical protein